MRRKILVAALLLGTSGLLAGCDQLKKVAGGKDVVVKETEFPERVLWGDTHLHTANSVDAFGFGVRLGPEEALRFARGEEVTSTTGLKAKLPRPLDFLVVTDHAEGLGATKALYDAPRLLIRDETMLRWYDMMHEGPAGSQRAMAEILDARGRNALPKAMLNPDGAAERTKSVWNSNIDTVERYNEPGKFTAFFGFEYTLMQGGNNLHRNIIFRDGPDRVRTVVPLDPTYKATPDEIWSYMEAYEKATGGRVLAIPHNSNLSNGLMFELTQPGGGPMTAAYAKRRAQHEPVVEITQIKGDSESHPFLSPNDEFAGFGVAGWELNNLLGNQPTAPQELPAQSRHLDCYLANVTYSDKVYHCTAIGAERALDGIDIAAIARGKTRADLVNDPSCITIISVNSPRRFDEAMSDGLMAMAEWGQATVITPFTLMGAMAPVSLAAALAQQNAEALAGIALTQLTRPGTPVVYGAFTSNVDLRSGAPAFGTAENARATLIGGQLARRYNLPYRASNSSASNTVDAQAAYESEMSLWSSVLGGANLVYHGAGWMEGGLTASFEKIVLDVEMLHLMAGLVQPFDVSDAELGLDAQREVPAGGHFFHGQLPLLKNLVVRHLRA